MLVYLEADGTQRSMASATVVGRLPGSRMLFHAPADRGVASAEKPATRSAAQSATRHGAEAEFGIGEGRVMGMDETSQPMSW